VKSFISTLRFRLWEHTVSHSTLLLRHRSPSVTVDIIFSGVDYMEIPDLFNGLEIGSATAQEEERLLVRANKKRENLPSYRAYLLLTGNRRFFIVAANCVVCESESGIAHLLSWGDRSQIKIVYTSLNPSAEEFQRRNP
jgi:hypothetical protein